LIYIGVDPGLSGAIGWTGYANGVIDMPTILWGKTTGKRAVDAGAVLKAIQHLPVLRPVVFIERVGPMVRAGVKQGAASMFSFGMSFGCMLGFFDGLQWERHLVTPQKWKAHFGLDADKNAALELARKLFPSLDLSKKKHHGRAEALLIARYGQETHKT
jgi:hypothetical protein